MQSAVATVNGNSITKFELENTIQEFSLQLHDTTVEELSAVQITELKKVAIEKLVMWEVIYNGALNEGLQVADEVIDQEMNEIVGEFSSAEEFFEDLGKAGMNRQAFRKYIAKDLVVNRMTERMIADAPEASASQIEEQYQSYLEDLAKKEENPKVRARHILIKVEEGASAEVRAQAVERINNIKNMDDDFAKLAEEYSECSSAAEGGDLGSFEHGQMAPAFEEAAFSQQVGVVGEVVETSFGYHLIKVEERSDQEKMSLAEATPKIRAAIREQAGVDQLREWATQLKSQASIEIKTDDGVKKNGQ